MAGRCDGLKSLRLGEFRDDCCLVFRLGLRDFWLGLGKAVVPFLGGKTKPVFLPIAELFLVDGAELLESELRLKRRELTGILDCESRLNALAEVGDGGRGWIG